MEVATLEAMGALGGAGTRQRSLLVETPAGAIALLPLEAEGGGGGTRPPVACKYGGSDGEGDPEGFGEDEESIVEISVPEDATPPLAEYFREGYVVRRVPVPKEL